MNDTERQQMEADIVCVGFGPATAGFLTTLTNAMVGEDGMPACKEDGTPLLESKVMPGCPLQVMCYERADDIGFGVSGIVTTARSIRASFPGKDLAQEIPNASDVCEEHVIYQFDHLGASKRTAGTKFVDAAFKCLKPFGKKWPQAAELPFIPPFLRKEPGLAMSMGQFLSWAGQNLMGSGLVQIWPNTPVAEPLYDGDKVIGVRMADQGVNKKGEPEPGAYMPGMDMLAPLTVVGDGPVGAVGRALNEKFGLPEGNSQHDWAVGMKAVVELPESCTLKPGTVIHTLGYPEPEIFGFFYVYPDRTASMGIFVPSWWRSPVRTAYRYLQHWMMHPSIWQHIEGGTLRSWGAKSLLESGIRGEPHLCGDGFARIGEGSGSTNVLTNSGVDEAWRTGVLLAEAVVEIWKEGADFSKANLEKYYVARRRADAQNKELEIARKARDGFQKGFFTGMMGTGMTGMTKGLLNLNVKGLENDKIVLPLESLVGQKITADKLEEIKSTCDKAKAPLHDAVMDAAGWPQIPFDGTLLMSQQDALFKGGKVQAAGGFADHVRFVDPEMCASCKEKTCIELCSAQAISPGEGGVPAFDREKCVHCGVCIWSCSKLRNQPIEQGGVSFTAGSGGLHSNEN